MKTGGGKCRGPAADIVERTLSWKTIRRWNGPSHALHRHDARTGRSAWCNRQRWCSGVVAPRCEPLAFSQVRPHLQVLWWWATDLLRILNCMRGQHCICLPDLELHVADPAVREGSKQWMELKCSQKKKQESTAKEIRKGDKGRKNELTMDADPPSRSTAITHTRQPSRTTPIASCGGLQKHSNTDHAKDSCTVQINPVIRNKIGNPVWGSHAS